MSASATQGSHNDDMVPRTHTQFDVVFKVWPLIDHFNQCFQAAKNPSKQQSIDEHMICKVNFDKFLTIVE